MPRKKRTPAGISNKQKFAERESPLDETVDKEISGETKIPEKKSRKSADIVNVRFLYKYTFVREGEKQTFQKGQIIKLRSSELIPLKGIVVKI